MKKSLLDYYNLLLYKRLIDYLLLKDNVIEELDKFKSIILTKDFVTKFKIILDDIEESSLSYPINAYRNATVILNYIKKNTDFKIDGLVKSVYSMNDFSDTLYSYEYSVKQLSLNMETTKSAVTWKKKDIEESILSDYLLTVSLSSSENNFLNEYFPSFIFSKNIVFSINKLMMENKVLLNDDEVKRRIRSIVKTNLSILSNEDEEEVIKLYISRNYKELDNINFNTQELLIFKELNQNIVNMLNNPKMEVYTIESIKDYYDYLKIENFIYSDGVRIDKSISLDNIYYYIDNALSITLKAKKRLIELLKAYKDKNKNFIMYDEYLDKIHFMNVCEDDIKNQFKTRSNILTYIKASFLNKTGDNTLYKNVLASREQDLYNFELLIKDNHFFNNNVMYINSLSFEHSLKKFMNEYPNMFLNEQILSRALQLISKRYGLDATCAENKLKKIKKV